MSDATAADAGILRTGPRMIDFACRCSHRFSLPIEEAGGVIQCPHCHRLVDIPNLSDLEHIDAEGNFKFEDDGTIPLAGEERLPRLHRAFTRQHTDETGEEIDLRPSMEDVMKAGSEELPPELADQISPASPKYDPVTGELIKPIEVKSDGLERIDPKTVPLAKRAVEYATGDLNQRIGILRIGGRLLQPVNLFVMSIIVLVHVMLQPVNLLMAAGLFLVVPLWIIGVGFLLAHYGNIIDETGPAERDELPRPLRDAELYQDIWRPFTHVAAALILCYWPLLLTRRLEAPLYVEAGVMLIVSFFFPAVLLTLSTSGSPANLRPDRVLGVISACGVRYFGVVLLFLAADALYGIGMWRFMVDSLLLFVPASSAAAILSAAPWWFEPWIAYPALLLGIYTMHWFCWSLGSAYRAHHDEFRWVFQRHISTRLKERTTLPSAAQRMANANSAAVKQKLGTR